MASKGGIRISATIVKQKLGDSWLYVTWEMTK